MPLRSARFRTVPRDAVHHPLFARCYARISVAAEARGMGPVRDRLLAGLSGRVIEIGAGNGLNFAHYPGTVAEVVAVEPDEVRVEVGGVSGLLRLQPGQRQPRVGDRLPARVIALNVKRRVLEVIRR